MVKILCSDCGSICTHNPVGSYGCPIHGPDGSIFMADEELCTVVELLIKHGIGVADTDIQYTTPNKAEITIHLIGDIPDGLLCGLPAGWRLRYGNQLHCLSPDSESAVHTMVNALEDWLESRPADGWKAILRLSNCSVVGE